eukprot:scaffold292760_cov31-Tisochrysis_lutea.AAC.3
MASTARRRLSSSSSSLALLVLWWTCSSASVSNCTIRAHRAERSLCSLPSCRACDRLLPSLFLIGSIKCGSSSLWAQVRGSCSPPASLVESRADAPPPTPAPFFFHRPPHHPTPPSP